MQAIKILTLICSLGKSDASCESDTELKKHGSIDRKKTEIGRFGK